MKNELITIAGVENVFSAPFFHEIVLSVNKPIDRMLHELAERGIQGGFALKEMYPELKDCLLLCATETKTADDINLLAHHLRDVLQGEKLACHA
jgi:glycine dehydrogenase subunit 1